MRENVFRRLNFTTQQVKRGLRIATVLLWSVVFIGLLVYFIHWSHRPNSSLVSPLPSSPDRVGRSLLVHPDTLTVVTLTGSTTYFTYRDEEMGYQYELIALWAEQMGLALQVLPVRSVADMLDSLVSRRADLAISPQPQSLIDSLGLQSVGPTWTDYQVLAQHSRSKHVSGAKTVCPFAESTIDLTNQRLVAIEGTPAALRLHHLYSELLGAIDTLYYSDTITQEELVGWVAADSIPYAIADYRLVRYLNSYYGTLDYHLPLSTPLESRWVGGPTLQGLMDSLQMWVDTLELDQRYKSIYKRNFEYSKVPDRTEIDQVPTPSMRRPGIISCYDYLFQQYADSIGWDWHVLAAIAYQESRFNPTSSSGAIGLMGIMPSTGRKYGYSQVQLKQAENSIIVACKTLRAFGREFSHISDPIQRMKFTLASYNAGSGHVHDACRLAEAYGDNPNLWDNHVEKYMRLLSESKYYNHETVRYGYACGGITIRYVREIYDRAKTYQRRTQMY